MNKAEVKEILKHRRREGYATHEMILDIYDDNEELPEDILDLVSQKVEPKRITLITGPEGAKLLKEVLGDQLNNI